MVDGRRRLAAVGALLALATACEPAASPGQETASSHRADVDSIDPDVSAGPATPAAPDQPSGQVDASPGGPAVASEESGGGSPPAVASEGPPVGVRRLPPVAATEEAPFGDGLVARVADTELVELDSAGPGEIAGPGVAVRLELRNDTGRPIDLGGVAVNAFVDEEPAVPSSADPSSPLKGVLPSGAARDGHYVFRVPHEHADALVLEVQHNAWETIVMIAL